jgi:hypothetical protein
MWMIDYLNGFSIENLGSGFDDILEMAQQKQQLTKIPRVLQGMQLLRGTVLGGMI